MLYQEEKSFIFPLILIAVVIGLIGSNVFLFFSSQKLEKRVYSLENPQLANLPEETSYNGVPSLIDESEDKKERKTFVGAFSSGFSPAGLSISPGDKIILTFTNHDKKPHSLTCEELGVDSGIIQPEQKKTIEFIVPDTPGKEYKFQSFDEAGDLEEGYEYIVIVSG